MQPRLKVIEQPDRKGCGLACVAMVTGRTYRAVRAKSVGCWRPGYGMNGRMLQVLLDRFGRTALGVTSRFTQMYSKLAIVKVLADLPHPTRPDRQLLFQHYVVWHDGMVYDPGPGTVWRWSNGKDGLERYLASLGHGARTGRWYWV